MMRFGTSLLPWFVGAGLTAGFWSPLLSGAGFLGGDVYNYFMPLKTFYAEGLKTGEIRFWHPKIGNGVSVLGESQTGVFFPAHLIAYRFLDVVPAYNAVFLLHTVLAFVFFVWLARHNGASIPASLLGATVFTFGWFAPRACLEWAATTGCWFPLEILAAQRWLETGRRRWGWLLAFVLCLQLSAGHYQLAWVSIVGIGLFAMVTSMRSGGVSDRSRRQDVNKFESTPETPVAHAPGSSESSAWKRRRGLIGFLLIGVLWAAPQLLPTWELKQLSTRSEAGFAEEVSYGRIPPKYLIQMVLPWPVYANPDKWLAWAGGDSNRIEAHFTLGLAPLLLLVFSALRCGLDARQWRWTLLVALGLFLATGIPFAILKYVPGFSFFRYPGRYSLIPALFGSLLVAAALDRISARPLLRFVVAVFIGAFAVGEFYWSSRSVGYVVMQNPPPLARAKDSEIFSRLTAQDRVFAPDGNTLALSPAACVPPYIGLQPALYYRHWVNVPDVFEGNVPAEPKLITRLQQVGVTHLLTRNPLPDGWPTTLVWSGYDPFLHPRWGRPPSQPLWLYRFDASLGRMWVAKPDGSKTPIAFTVGSDEFDVKLPALPQGGRLRTTEWAMSNAQSPPTHWTVTRGAVRLPIDLNAPFVEIELPPSDGPTTLKIQYAPVGFYHGLIVVTFGAFIALILMWRRNP